MAMNASRVLKASVRGYKLGKVVFEIFAILMTLALLGSLETLIIGAEMAGFGVVLFFGLYLFYGGGLLYAIGLGLSFYAVCGLKHLLIIDRAVVIARFSSLIMSLALTAGVTACVFTNNGLSMLESLVIWVTMIDLSAVIILAVPKVVYRWMARKTGEVI